MPQITWEAVKDDIELFWDHFYLSKNPHILLNMYELYPHRFDKHKIWVLNDTFADCEEVSWDLVEEHPNFDWDWSKICRANMLKTKETFMHHYIQLFYSQKVLGDLEEYFIRPDNLNKGIYLEDVTFAIQNMS